MDNNNEKKEKIIPDFIKEIIEAGRNHADTPSEVDLMKAENYIHRARTGKWLPKERLDPFGGR